MTEANKEDEQIQAAEREVPACTGCGHVCPTQHPCPKCGGDAKLMPDRLCVACVTADD